MNKDKTQIPQVETRCFPSEVRMEGEGESRKVVGYAAVYNSDSEVLWDFRERIAPGAFDGVLGDDVRALFNHDPNMLLARTTSGTLRLSVDERGLRYEFDAPNTTAGNDLLEMLRRGDISQSSFGFTVEEDEWEKNSEGMPLRTVKKIKRLYDVSPVTYPAYSSTEVALRSLESWKAEQEQKDEPEPKQIRHFRRYWR